MTLVVRYLPLFKLRICWLITVSALVGLIASPGAVSLEKAAFLAVATMAAAAAASVLNHYFDRDIDRLMDRTRSRPLEKGCTPFAALALAALLFAFSAAVALWKLGYMAALHLMLGAFVYAVVYTAWLKRRSWTNIIVGGLSGSFAMLAGGAASPAGLSAATVMLAVVMFFWTPSHFWSFAIVHREDYDRARVPMLPSVVGNMRASRFILVNTGLLVASSFAPVINGDLGLVYCGAAVLAGAFFLYRNIQLVRDTSSILAQMNFRASMVYLGSLFAGVALDAMASWGVSA
ncbi:MAG: protoheme IX farnesyltransferase [Deltaproteobacteria bacterium]|nr:protoheme IX farnesyltransferase [Deltaproteobacteria bacterium]